MISGLLTGFSGKALDALESGFLSPPDSAKPRVWWHWMNGNVTKEGIAKDLEWMKRVGIGGLQNFDGALETPQIVEQRLVYMTPPWRDAFKYAAELSDRLGLELAIASSPGWSQTGGPWVKPQDGMKKLVWSLTRVPGGQPFKGKLAAPPSVAGPYQGVPITDVFSNETGERPRFYRDVAVLAYRTPKALWQDLKPVKVTTSDSAANAQSLIDGDLAHSIALPAASDKPAWVLYDYGKSRRLRSTSIGRNPMTKLTWVLEAGDDGQSFRKLAELPRNYLAHHLTLSFPALTARFIRLTITPPPFKPRFSANAPGAESEQRSDQDTYRAELSELQFYGGARVHRFEDKAGFSIAANYYAIDSGPNSSDEAVDPKDVFDLTDRMRADGSFEWTAPAGEWTVLRLGYSLTGKTNHPASPEATGLEVDKLDKAAVKAYLDSYLDSFEKTVGPGLMGSRGLKAFLTDSIEWSTQNWTPAMLAQFKRRRGYEMKPWMPALTGVIVGDAARTDRFLWDFRKTLMELIADAHYKQIAESAHERGLTYYGESLEGHPTIAIGDDMDMRQHADIPMAAFWASYASDEGGIFKHFIVDMQGAASVAHIFGRTVVAAESLTSANEPWAFSPASLRPVMDLAFAMGINRPVIHTSVHQPIESKPGLTLGPYGQHFTRHETWGELARPWVTYLSRTSYLLQQGKFAADVAWFYGEEGPLASLYTGGPPADLPKGYGFDFVNANLLLNHLGARDGHLVSSGGARYRLLYLGGTSERMTLAVLRKLKELSSQNVAIAGRRPIGSPSFADEDKQAEYERLVTELWDGGKIVESADPNEALVRLNLARDFDYDQPKADSRVMFLHRNLPEGDLYFLTNRKARPERIEARFRVTGRKPELWHADSGQREAVSWRIENDCTVVPLDLQANQSLFVVFREPTGKMSEEVAAPAEHVLARLDGAWDLSFEPGRGGPDQPLSTQLGSWSESKQVGIKYFSGVGTYRKSFTLRPVDLMGVGDGARIELDLGRVHELAEVTVNGKSVGAAWHTPFRVDVTDALKPGANVLEVRVANLWVNRLIGDKQPGATPVAFTVTATYEPDAPLRASGLLGPVTLIKREMKPHDSLRGSRSRKP